MAEAEITGEEVAHVGAENAGNAQRRPIARPERRQMDRCMRSRLRAVRPCWFPPARMRAGALRQQCDASDDDGRKDSRGIKAAEVEPAIAERLVEQVAQRRAQRPGQDEGGPEQQRPRDRR